jgi:hypothetical protein
LPESLGSGSRSAQLLGSLSALLDTDNRNAHRQFLSFCSQHFVHNKVNISRKISLTTEFNRGAKIPEDSPPIVMNMNKINEVQDPSLIIELSRIHNEAEKEEDRSYKLLGVTLDECLTFDKHIDLLCSKLTRANFFLRRVQHKIPENRLRDLYFALFHSHILYCINIYSCTSKKNIKRLQTLQKKAIRIISCTNTTHHTVNLFRKHDILPIESLIIFSNLKLAHSIMYKYSHPPLQTMMRRNETRDTGYELRNNEHLLVPHPKTDFFKRFPLYKFPTVWNEAGDVIYHSNPITFSIALKMELLEKLV